MAVPGFDRSRVNKDIFKVSRRNALRFHRGLARLIALDHLATTYVESYIFLKVTLEVVCHPQPFCSAHPMYCLMQTSER